MARLRCTGALRRLPRANLPPSLLLFHLRPLTVSIRPMTLSPQPHRSPPSDMTCQSPTTPSTSAGALFPSSLAQPLMIIRATEYSQLLIPSPAVALWVWTSADSLPTPTPIWPQPPITVEITICMQVRAQFADIALTGVVNPTRCLELKRQISTAIFPLATARFLPIVRLCRMCSRMQRPTRWMRPLCRSNIPRPYSPPDITMGCTPRHHAQLLNRFRVLYPIQISPSAIPLLLPRLLPQALANHRISWRPLSTATLSHPSQTPIKRKKCPPTFPMDLSPPASVPLRPLPIASQASPAPSIQNLEASMSTRPTSIHTRDANHSKCSASSPPPPRPADR